MKIAEHQPDFLPWIGFWGKVVAVDTMVLRPYDQLDYDCASRVKLEDKFVGLDVSGKTYMDATFAKISKVKLYKTLQQVLCSKKLNPYRARLGRLMDLIEAYQGVELYDFNILMLGEMYRLLGLEENWVVGEYKDGPTKTSRLYQSVLEIGGPESEYYSGAGGARYMVKEEFPVKVKVQKVVNSMGGVTMLQLIARESDPLMLVKECSTWSDWS